MHPEIYPQKPKISRKTRYKKGGEAAKPPHRPHIFAKTGKKTA
jgi:hypothetical protein